SARALAGDDLVAGLHAAADLGAAAVAGSDPHLHRLALAVDQAVDGGTGRAERGRQGGVPALLLRFVEGAGEVGEVLLHALEHALAHLRAHGRVRGAGTHAGRPARSARRLARALALALG